MIPVWIGWALSSRPCFCGRFYISLGVEGSSEDTRLPDALHPRQCYPRSRTITAGFYPCYPVAVLAFILDEDGRILLLSRPDGKSVWEVPSGAIEADETILEGVLREAREEVGNTVSLKPLGTLHTQTVGFRAIPLISVAYLLAYEGGVIETGSDMCQARANWWSLEQLSALEIAIPDGQTWLFRRAVTLHELWRHEVIDLARGSL